MVNAQARIVVPLSNKQEDFRGVRRGRLILAHGRKVYRERRGGRLEGSLLVISRLFVLLCTFVYLN